jgi:quinolinate synthase
MAHPECRPEVVEASDFSGSTANMIDFVDQKRPPKVMLITECSMSDNIAVHHPEIEYIRPCRLCPHMKQITLPKIREALELMQFEVKVDPAIAGRARLAVERMLAVR